MSDTFTKNYNWTKPDVGASDDTWGDKLNANLDAIDADLKAADDKSGLPEAPMDQQTYGRDNATWVALPASYMPEAPNTSQRFGRYNSVWQLDAIQTDAPSDGGAYARQNGGWTAAVTGGPYLPLTGGTMTGALIMQGSNMIALNAPLTGGGQAAILGQKATVNRWQMMLGDQTAEGTGNAGSNFSLGGFGVTGQILGTWLTIARADGATVFNGSGVTIQGGLAVNGTLAMAGPGQFALGGGTNGQVLATNGSGALSWATRLADAPSDGQFYTRQNAAWAVAPGGMTDAPNDGTAYARKSAAWAHLTHTDITDWTATLAPYALTTAVPVASTTTPLMNGTAAVGTGTTWARADHIHPTDTSRAAATAVMNDNRIINGDMRIDARNNGASGTAIGVYTVDRWQYASGQASKGTWGRIATGPSGFPYSLNFTSSSAYASLATDTFGFAQPIEADMVSDFAWGTAAAQPVTLSFWVFSNQAGTFSGAIRNQPNPPTRSFPFSFSLAATTWTKIVLTIPGDTAGTWVMSGNAAGAQLMFDLGAGANQRGPANVWASANYFGVTGTVSVVGVNGANFYLTGVKLEIGSVATPYNRQSLAKSMADCQRYYVQNGGASGITFQVQGWMNAGAVAHFSWTGPVTMRAAPTISANFSGLSNCTVTGFSGGTTANDARTVDGALAVTATGQFYAAMNIVSLSAEL